MTNKKVVLGVLTAVILALLVYAADKVNYINQDKCTQCGVCVDECPEEAIEVIKKGKKEIHVINQDKCTQCGVCVDGCPEEAISLVDPSEIKEGNKKIKGKGK